MVFFDLRWKRIIDNQIEFEVNTTNSAFSTVPAIWSKPLEQSYDYGNTIEAIQTDIMVKHSWYKTQQNTSAILGNELCVNFMEHFMNYDMLIFCVQVPEETFQNG